MSARALSPNFFGKLDDATLLRARGWLADALDFRSRQANLFELSAPVEQLAPTDNRSVSNVSSPTTPAPPPVSVLVPEVLSPSSVNCFVDCSAKWYYRRVLGLEETRSGALAIGSAVHEAVTANFRQKIDTREDLATEGVRLVARDSLERQLDEGVVLAPDETASDLVDTVDALVATYMSDAAPAIQPAAVELAVEGIIGGVPVRGYVDLLDVDGRVIDLKTAGKKPCGVTPSHRLQVTTYTLLTPGASGVGRLDTLTKTKTVRHYSETFEITRADRRYAERLYSIAQDQMGTGLVAPNRGSRVCGRKYCSFADRCVADYGGEVA